jgi:hypothetical protein
MVRNELICRNARPGIVEETVTSKNGRRSAMSAHLNPFKVAAVLGTVMGGFHLCWSILVALGWAQSVIDFVFWAHFIKPIYVIEPFEFARAMILLFLTAGIGFILGLVFTWVWNAPHRTRKRPVRHRA